MLCNLSAIRERENGHLAKGRARLALGPLRETDPLISKLDAGVCECEARRLGAPSEREVGELTLGEKRHDSVVEKQNLAGGQTPSSEESAGGGRGGDSEGLESARSEAWELETEVSTI